MSDDATVAAGAAAPTGTEERWQLRPRWAENRVGRTERVAIAGGLLATFSAFSGFLLTSMSQGWFSGGKVGWYAPIDLVVLEHDARVGLTMAYILSVPRFLSFALCVAALMMLSTVPKQNVYRTISMTGIAITLSPVLLLVAPLFVLVAYCFSGSGGVPSVERGTRLTSSDESTSRELPR